MDLMKKRWAVLVASVVVSICIGTGLAWSVYQTGLFNEGAIIFGTEVQRSQLALAFTICGGVVSIPTIAGNGLQKELKGPRNVVWLGGTLFGTGLTYTSPIHNLAMLYVIYEPLYGFGIAFVCGVIIDNTMWFFPNKRELIADISTAAYEADSIIFPPIIRSLIGSGGVMSTLRVLGTLFGIMIIVTAYFITEPPEGWLSTGWTSPAVRNSSSASAGGENWELMLADTGFYLMIIVSTMLAIDGLMVVGQGSPTAQAADEVDAVMMATTVSTTGLTNTGGRVLWGWVFDKAGRYSALSIMAVIVTVGGFTLSVFTGSGPLTLFLVFTMLIAACYGGSTGVYPTLTADAFRIRYNGVNYGVMFIGSTLGSYIGPILADNLYDNTRSCSVPLTVVGTMGVVALIILFVLTAMKEQAQG